MKKVEFTNSIDPDEAADNGSIMCDLVSQSQHSSQTTDISK